MSIFPQQWSFVVISRPKSPSTAFSWRKELTVMFQHGVDTKLWNGLVGEGRGQKFQAGKLQCSDDFSNLPTTDHQRKGPYGLVCVPNVFPWPPICSRRSPWGFCTFLGAFWAMYSMKAVGSKLRYMTAINHAESFVRALFVYLNFQQSNINISFFYMDTNMSIAERRVLCRFWPLRARVMEENVVVYERKSGNFDEFFKQKRRMPTYFGVKEHTPTSPASRCIWKWNSFAGKG